MFMEKQHVDFAPAQQYLVYQFLLRTCVLVFSSFCLRIVLFFFCCNRLCRMVMTEDKKESGGIKSSTNTNQT